MKNAAQKLREKITPAFIKELEAFKRGGYRFNNGSDKELFPGTQREAFNDYLDGVKAQHRGGQAVEGYYEIPTGVGKTALFIAIIGCYLKATENMPDAPRVLIHVPSNDLEKQTARSFAEFLPRLAPMIETDDEEGKEINWQESEIGFKRKGAAGDKKIVITTYQGQAADERSHAKKGRPRAYKPEEFGLIIHDEAHYTTGAKFGPAAIDKFRGAIQLGVTATPEYSPDKTVANKLANRYYELPLANVEKDGEVVQTGAIERGDLCHVRPILIKTRLTEEEKQLLRKKAKEFFAARKGQPLTEGQLAQLYNQQSRNRAVIKAYLAGVHPDTGERYLGQTGMIFAGGIQHCKDFITNAEDVLNQPAYKDVKKWLRDEGLCLIAPIHSGTTNGVEITIGGEKRRCTEDEIKDLHRQGKVLLIISDKKLREGTDFPRDSFGADLIDRFSVPDATQRFGRLLRVHPDERNMVPEDRTKSSAWFNVIDETTHEIYAGTPHHPIHAIEILRGAEHRPPGRKGGMSRFVPQVHEIGEQLGFTFEHDVEALRDVTRRFREGRKKKLPEKTEEWLSPRDIRQLPGGQDKSIVPVVDAVTGLYNLEALGEQEIQYKGQSIRVQKMQAGPQQPICIYREDLSKVKTAAGILPDKDDNWLSQRDAENMPGGGRQGIQAAVKNIIEAYDSEALGEQKIKYKGYSIRAQKMRSGSAQPICIYRKDWSKVEKAAGVIPGGKLPDKDDNWLSQKDLEKIPGGSRRIFKPIIDAIMGIYDLETLGEQEIKYKGQSFRIQKVQYHNKQPICIHRDDWSKMIKVAETLANEQSASNGKTKPTPPRKWQGSFADRFAPQEGDIAPDDAGWGWER